MLVIIFNLLLCHLCLCTPSQYNLSGYEPNAYPFDEYSLKHQYNKTCGNHGMRKCSIKDINMHQLSGRYSCHPKWAYFPEFGGNAPVVLISDTNKCNTTKNTPNGVYPRIVKDTSKVQNTFYCRIKTGNESHPTDIEYCTGNGGDYKGYKATNKAGKPCQRWDYTLPNKVKEKTSKEDYNFCRNPGGKKKKPWCYHRDENGCDYCDVDCNQWGKQEKCKIKYGKDCTKSINPGEVITIDFHCKHDNFFQFIKIEGTYCVAVIKYKDDIRKITEHSILKDDDIFLILWVYLKLATMTLINYSSDVILKPKEDKPNDYYKICTIDEIDMADNFKDLSRTGIGLAQHNGRNWLYSYGYKKPSPYKGVWCCTNEFITVSSELIKKNETVNYCGDRVREESFEIRGKALVYKHRRRMCTNVDMATHLEYLDNPNVEYCYVRTSSLGWGVLLTNGVKYSNVSHDAKVCCCDEDCLPINFLCVKNEHCCSGKCSKGRCYDEQFPKSASGDSKDLGGSRFPNLLIFIGVLYCFGWIMRICCPERRTTDRMVKNVAE